MSLPKKQQFITSHPQRPPLIGRREMYVLVIMVLLAGILIEWIRGSYQPPVDTSVTSAEPQLAPMHLPPITDLPAPLNAEEFEVFSQALAKSVTTRPVAVNGWSSANLMWMHQQLQLDQEERTIPRRFSRENIIQGSLPDAEPVIITAQLIDSRQVIFGQEEWYWIVLGFAADAYVIALVDDLSVDAVIGEDVRVTARYLGRLPYSVDREKEQIVESEVNKQNNSVKEKTEYAKHVSVYVGARAFPEPEQRNIAQVLNLGEMPKTGVDPNWKGDPRVYDEIDDIAPVLESRPYYYLLGQVMLVDAYRNNDFRDAPDATQLSGMLHNDPKRYRTNPFRITGTVRAVWKDEDVATDKPFGISTVHRIQLYNRVFEPFEELDTLTGEVTVSKRWVLHTYELAMPGEKKVPEIGQTIEAYGRFLKVHGVFAEKDLERDQRNGVYRQSDNVYFKFFVISDWEDRTPEVLDTTGVTIAFLIFVGVFWGWLMIVNRFDSKHDNKREQIRKLRGNRRKLEKQLQVVRVDQESQSSVQHKEEAIETPNSENSELDCSTDVSDNLPSSSESSASEETTNK